MAALVALGQKGALGHSLGEQFRARTMSDRRLENFAHGEKSGRAICVEYDWKFRAIILVATGGDGRDLHASTAQLRRDHQPCRSRLPYPDP